MKSATRVLATCATCGVVAGGAVALLQVPHPKNVAMSSSTGGTGSSQAIQQLIDQSSQLHAAVEAARAQLGPAAAGPSTPGSDSTESLTQQLAQANAALDAARRQLAIDEALVAKLSGGKQHAAAVPTSPSTFRATPTRTGDDTPSQSSTAEAAATIVAAPSTPSTPRPTRTRSVTPSPSPTNGHGDD